MNVRGGRVTAIVALACALMAPVPAGALPSAEPTLVLEARRIGFTLTYDLILEARDRDGAIRSLSVCVEEACARSERASSPAGDIAACLAGDSATVGLRHTFSAPGTFTATLSAQSGGCPVVGADQAVVEHEQIVVPDPPPPHDPIVCAEPGTPAATDVGVHEDRVVVGTIATMSGAGASFKGGAAAGMHAAVRAINSMGGVCDRLIDLRIVDDGDSRARGEEAARTMIESGEVFALLGVPAGGIVDELEASGMPDVGTFGDSVEEFASALVWPTGPGNHAFGWIAVDEAYEQGARTFAVVYDGSEPRGTETRDAVADAVASYEGASISTSVELMPARASYSAEVTTYNTACSNGCDAVIIALAPPTYRTWAASRPRPAQIRTSLHPDLMHSQTAATCGAACAGDFVWTGYQPLIGGGSIERVCSDIRTTHPTSDCSDPRTLAGYESVFVAARAMGHAGVDLTRAAFGTALDAHPFDAGLHGGPLSWATARQANRWMRAYEVVVAQASFAGWREAGDWREDPR